MIHTNVGYAVFKVSQPFNFQQIRSKSLVEYNAYTSIGLLFFPSEIRGLCGILEGRSLLEDIGHLVLALKLYSLVTFAVPFLYSECRCSVTPGTYCHLCLLQNDGHLHSNPENIRHISLK